MRNQRREQTWTASSDDACSGQDEDAIRPGARVGRYCVEAHLGEGGSAHVWRVRHVELNVDRALKVLKRGHAASVARLAREARLQADIEHPHVVRVYDVLDLAGRPALVMALSQNGSLSDALEQGRMDAERVAQIGRDLACGLGAIHARGIVHRDVKPSNVLLMGPQRRAALTDFGIARESDSDATQTGEVLGTPAYMAPEQLRATAQVGPSADLYAFGVVLYELLEGARPPQSLPEIARRLAAHPRPIAQLIVDCLQPEADMRPSAAEALERLSQVARPRGRSLRWLSVGLLVGLCGILAWIGSRTDTSQVRRPAASTAVDATLTAQRTLLERAFERLGADPGQAAALWRAAEPQGSATFDRALWDAGGDVRVLPTRAEIVDVLATHDGQRIVGLTSTGWVHLWDRQTGKRIFAMDSATKVPASAHLSADGRLVAVVPHSARSTAGARSQVRVLDLATGKVVFTASNGDTTSATYFAFSPDSAKALTYSNARSLTTWDVRTGAQTGRLILETPICSNGAVFDPQSEQLATLGNDGTLRMYDARLELTSELKVTGDIAACAMYWTKAHGIVVNSGGALAQVDPTTQTIVARAPSVGVQLVMGREHIVAFDKKSVKILNAATLTLASELAHPIGVLDVEFNRSETQVATAGVDGIVRVWSTRTGRLLHALKGHQSWTHALTSSSDQHWELWSAGRDRTLRAWRLPEPDGVAFDFRIDQLRAAARGRLVLGSGANTWAAYALDRGEGVLQTPASKATLSRAIVASPDGHHLLVRRRDHMVLHSLEDGEPRTQRLPIQPGYRHWLIGRDPIRIAIGSTRVLRTLSIGEAGLREVRHKTDRNPSHVGLTADGQWLYMASYDQTLTVWPVDADAAAAPTVIDMGCSEPASIKAVEATSVILGDWAGCMERWNLATGKREGRWAGHTDAITQLEAHASGWLSSSLDGTLRLWGHGGEDRVLGRHVGGAFGFTANGDRVVSIGADAAIRTWSLSTPAAGPVEYLPSRPRVIWGTDDAVQVVDNDGLIWSQSAARRGVWNNLRVCPETFDVVPVVPFPQEHGIWAPATACRGQALTGAR